jgi:hypothetical protein
LLSLNILSPSLEPDVVGTVALSNSLHRHSGSDIEWPVDMKTELLVEALGSDCLSFVYINDLPSLVGIIFLISISGVHNESLTFVILRVKNFDYLIVRWVHKLLTLELENLEPSRVSAPDLHVSCSS